MNRMGRALIALVVFSIYAPAQNLRDSAGVRIVAVAIPERGGPIWKLSSKPILEISPDAEETLLFNVAAEPHRVSDSLIVFTAATHEFYNHEGNIGWATRKVAVPVVFDLRGRYLRTIGGIGSGPREFFRLSNLVPSGDSIVAFECTIGCEMKTLHVSGTFGSDGYIDRTGMEGSPRVVGAFADGSLAIYTVPYETTGFKSGPNSSYFRIDREGKQLGRILGPVVYQMKWLPESWPTYPTAATGKNTLFYTSGGSYTIEVYNTAGRQTRILRLGRTPRKPTKADLDWWKASVDRLSKIHRGAGNVKKYLTGSLPAQFAPIAQLLVDKAGNLWVREGSVPGIPPGNWLIISPEGRYLGSATTPEYFEVSEIGRDYVLGIYHADDGSTSVRMYGLSR
jgi:hypothetical protein